MPNPHHGPPSPPPPLDRSGERLRGLTATAFASVSLAVLSAVAAVVVLIGPFDTVPSGAETADGEVSEAIDLTEGLEPFDPYANEDYYGVSLHELVWVPPSLPSEWEVSYDEQSASAVTFTAVIDDESWATVHCSDIDADSEYYPDSFEDPEAWYEGEVERGGATSREGNEFEQVSGPDYTRYLIDGREAVLVEFQRHWTRYEDAEGEVRSVDYVASRGYLFVDLPANDGDGGDTVPVTPARCYVFSNSDDLSYYTAGIETLLDIRLWLE